MFNNIVLNEKLLYLKGNKLSTTIFFTNKDIYVDQDINVFLDINCKFYGSSLKGRLSSSGYLLNNKYKCPIVLDEVKKIILFKIMDNDNYYWINYNSIINLFSLNDGVEILFKNNSKLWINSSMFIINNQISKSALLISILKSKIQ